MLGKGKGKIHPRAGHEGPEREWRYTLYSFLNLGASWLKPRPGRIIPGKTQYLFYRRLGGPQGRSGRVRKIKILERTRNELTILDGFFKHFRNVNYIKYVVEKVVLGQASFFLVILFSSVRIIPSIHA